MNAAMIRPINYSLRLGWVADSAAAFRDAADAHFGMVAHHQTAMLIRPRGSPGREANPN
jgi:hypothetical protein